MIVLDVALAYLQSRRGVFIVDIDLIQDLESLRTVMPQALLFYRTPVVAEYKSGKLVRLEQGKDAERLLISRRL